MATLNDELLQVTLIIPNGGLFAAPELHVIGTDAPASPGAEGGWRDVQQGRGLLVGQER